MSGFRSVRGDYCAWRDRKEARALEAKQRPVSAPVTPSEPPRKPSLPPEIEAHLKYAALQRRYKPPPSRRPLTVKEMRRIRARLRSLPPKGTSIR